MVKEVELNIYCNSCYNNIFKIIHGSYICINCDLMLLSKNNKNSSNIFDINKNKLVHLNNILKKMETIDLNLLNKLYLDLSNILKKEKIKKCYIDNVFISKFLKKKKIKNYIIEMFLLNKIHNINFYLTEQNKQDIRLIFSEYIKFNNTNSNFFLYKKTNSISYYKILSIIFKYLNIDSSIKDNNIYFSDEIFDQFIFFIKNKNMKSVNNNDNCLKFNLNKKNNLTSFYNF